MASSKVRVLFAAVLVAGVLLTPSVAQARTVDCRNAADDIAAVQAAVDAAAAGGTVRLRGTCDFSAADAHGGDVASIAAAAVVVRPGAPVNGLTIESASLESPATILGSGMETAFFVAPGNAGVTIQGLRFAGLARAIVIANAPDATIGATTGGIPDPAANRMIGDVTTDSSILALATDRGFGDPAGQLSVRYGAGGAQETSFAIPAGQGLTGLRVLGNYITYTHPGLPDGETRDIVGIDVRARFGRTVDGVEIRANAVGLLTSEFPSFNISSVKLQSIPSAGLIHNVTIIDNNFGRLEELENPVVDVHAGGRAAVVLIGVSAFDVRRNLVRARLTPTGAPMPGGGVVVSDSAGGSIRNNDIAVVADPSIQTADLGGVGLLDDIMTLFDGAAGPPTERIVVVDNLIGPGPLSEHEILLGLGLMRGMVVNGALHSSVGRNDVRLSVFSAINLGVPVSGPGSLSNPGTRTLHNPVHRAVVCSNLLDGATDDPDEVNFDLSAGSSANAFPRGGNYEGNLNCPPLVSLTPGAGGSLVVGGTSWALRPLEVRVQSGGAEVVRPLSSAAGGSYGTTFSAADLAGLPEGNTCATTTAMDDLASGLTGVSTPACTTRDLTAPDPPVITNPREGDVFTTCTVLVTGTAEAGTTVRVLEAITVLAAAPVDATGHWSVSICFTVGVHSITATATDPSGNVSAPSAPVAFRIDPTATGIHPFPALLSPSPFTVRTGTSTLPVSWQEVQGGEPVAGYVLIIGRPTEFNRVHFRRYLAGQQGYPCAVGTCSATLTFPLATPTSPLLANDKYAVGAVTIFADGHRSDGMCDDGTAFGASCSANLSHPPGYSYAEVLVESRAWPSIYQDPAKKDVLLVDPATNDFVFVVWNPLEIARLYRATALLAVPFDRTYFAYASLEVAIVAAYDDDDAQAVVVEVDLLPGIHSFDGRRL